jgi:hypothetical protein
MAVGIGKSAKVFRPGALAGFSSARGRAQSDPICRGEPIEGWKEAAKVVICCAVPVNNDPFHDTKIN